MAAPAATAPAAVGIVARHGGGSGARKSLCLLCGGHGARQQAVRQRLQGASAAGAGVTSGSRQAWAAAPSAAQQLCAPGSPHWSTLGPCTCSCWSSRPLPIWALPLPYSRAGGEGRGVWVVGVLSALALRGGGRGAGGGRVGSGGAKWGASGWLARLTATARRMRPPAACLSVGRSAPVLTTPGRCSRRAMPLSAGGSRELMAKGRAAVLSGDQDSAPVMTCGMGQRGQGKRARSAQARGSHVTVASDPPPQRRPPTCQPRCMTELRLGGSAAVGRSEGRGGVGARPGRGPVAAAGAGCGGWTLGAHHTPVGAWRPQRARPGLARPWKPCPALCKARLARQPAPRARQAAEFLAEPGWRAGGLIAAGLPACKCAGGNACKTPACWPSPPARCAAPVEKLASSGK